MPTALTPDGSQRGQSLSPVATTIAFTVALAFASCDRRSAQAPTEKPKPLALVATADVQPSSSPKKDTKKKLYSHEGYAVWYTVPVDSLANRRAGKGEFTAAHNQLALGSMVRVTHLANGNCVNVRITDRGITKRGASIDLCKPAAEQLGIVSEGMARVRIEELPDDSGTDAPPDPKTTASHP